MLPPNFINKYKAKIEQRRKEIQSTLNNEKTRFTSSGLERPVYEPISAPTFSREFHAQSNTK
jgi:hypothetical protein